MRLTEGELRAYQKNGFVLIPRLFTQPEVDILKQQLPREFGEDSPRRVVENQTGIVRSIYGSHFTNPVLQRLTRHPRLLQPAMQILGSKVYTYQFKINAKAAFGGDVWEWHQDFIFWHKEDGMPSSRVTSVAIFLDEVTEFNGPLFVIPRSHREGAIDLAPRPAPDYAESEGDKPWLSNLTVGLKYALDKKKVLELATRYGISAIKGAVGSTLFFDSNLVHASSTNISPFDRAVIIISFNSIANTPLPVERPRPEFLASRDYRPLVPVADNALLL
jgi:ectoine hydroxylase-related dioxygenase (phytanoyl-CoA dioxygenase family)